MANDISGAVWRIDTAPFSYNAPVKIVNFNATGGTGRVVLTTVKGKPIIDLALPVVNSGFIGWVPSLMLVTLSGATINISVGAGR